MPSPSKIDSKLHRAISKVNILFIVVLQSVENCYSSSGYDPLNVQTNTR